MRLLLLLLPLLLLVGCATPLPSSVEQDNLKQIVDKCYVNKSTRFFYLKTYETYIGQCISLTMTNDLNAENRIYWATQFGLRSNLYNLHRVNGELKDLISDKQLSELEANDIYLAELNDFTNLYFEKLTEQDVINEKQREINRQRWEDFSKTLALIAVAYGEAYNQSQRANIETTTVMPLSRNNGKTLRGILKDEYTDGFNKVCIYDTVRGVKTTNRKSVSICPLAEWFTP